MIVGCYSMHLYCDTGNDEPGMPGDNGNPTPHDYRDEGNAEFTGRTEADCIRQAKALGWRFTRNKRAICPRCNRGS